MGYQGKRAAGSVAAPVSPTSVPKKGKKGKVILLLIILLLLAVIGALVWFFVLHPPAPAGLQADPNVQVGSNSMTQAEREAELNKLVDEGMLTFYINSTPMYSLSRPEQGCNWLIENPKENNNRFTVTITRDDTGDVVYQSGYLDPEQYIDVAPLKEGVTLPKGEYSCTAIFSTYSLEEGHEPLGQGGALITLYITD